MRRAFWAALPIALTLTASAPGQFWPAPCRPILVQTYGLPYGLYPYSPFRPTVVIVQQIFPRIAVEDVRRRDELPIIPDDVIVIRPRAGGFKNLPPPRQAMAAPPRLPEPPPKIPGFDPPGRQAPPPAADKLAESARQQALGREAFAAGEYGRAAERFEQAARMAPDQPLNLFLLAQAQYAMGKFRDAAASILLGMKIQPDWPLAKFDARDPYRDHPAEQALHLERLRQAVERNPDEPALLFLYGYQLWFNDRRDEAKPYFRRAAPHIADPAPIERFLAAPVASR